MSKKVIRIISVLLAIIMALSVIVGVLSSVASAAPSQEALNKLKKEQSGLKQKMQDLQSEINSLTYDKKVTTAKKELLDEKVALTQEDIDNITAQIQEYDNLIAEKEEEAKDLERQQEEQRDLYKKRIRAMEENGSISYYAIIFGARSFTDMLFRLDAVDAIMENDVKIYDDLVAAEEATKQARLDIEATKEEQEGMRTELEEAQALLEEQVAEANKLIADLEADIAESEALYDEMYDEENRLMEEIEEMAAELERMKSVKGTGSFIWPSDLRGKVTSFFGWRLHPVYKVQKNHNGIDIGGLGYGANVVAADGGTVVTSANSSSYGNYIVINHGNGYSTLYAHMSKRYYSKGDTVKQGDVIGLVGSTGVSTGPHIHFEIWKNGVRVNPLDYYSDYDVASGAW